MANERCLCFLAVDSNWFRISVALMPATAGAGGGFDRSATTTVSSLRLEDEDELESFTSLFGSTPFVEVVSLALVVTLLVNSEFLVLISSDFLPSFFFFNFWIKKRIFWP